MFLCDKCHDPKMHFSHYSYGRCESCSKTANCIDCHYSQCPPPKKGTNGKNINSQAD